MLLLTANQSIVFEGDSNTSRRNPPCLDTWAYLRMNNWDITYADRFEEWLFCNRPELKTKVRNSAVGGSSIRCVLSRYEKNIKPAKPDWLIMTVHANDSAQAIPLGEFTDGLHKLCTDLHADSRGRVLWVDTGRDNDNSETGQRTLPYRQAAKVALSSHDALIAPAGDILTRKEAAMKELWEHHTVRTCQDGHLSIIGAEIVSTLVLQTLGVIQVMA